MNRNVPLRRVVPLRQGAPLQSRTPLAVRVPLARNVPVRRVSASRQRENRERAKMADRRWPGRREGTVMCECGRPECSRRADDLHETLSRARSGGSITDPRIWKPLSRACHDEVTFRPESELGWAYRNGVLKHDALCCRGRDACERYAEGGAA